MLDNGGNDSMAFKVGYYDFRGEKGRDKSLDISQSRFNTSTFLTKQERATEAVEYAKEKFFQERYTRDEECQN